MHLRLLDLASDLVTCGLWGPINGIGDRGQSLLWWSMVKNDFDTVSTIQITTRTNALVHLRLQKSDSMTKPSDSVN